MRISDWSSDVCSSDLQFADQLGRIAAQNRIDESADILFRRFRRQSVNRIVSDVGGLLGGSIEIKAEFFDFVRHQGPVAASQFSDPPADVSGEAQPLFAADGSGKLFGIPPLRRIAGKRDRKSTRLNSSH